MSTIDATNVTKSMLAESHRRQFNGEDWQAAATDIWQGIPQSKATEEDFNLLSTSPDPGCECGFCRFADWRDE